jgi:hypothetical protein
MWIRLCLTNVLSTCFQDIGPGPSSVSADLNLTQSQLSEYPLACNISPITDV